MENQSASLRVLDAAAIRAIASDRGVAAIRRMRWMASPDNEVHPAIYPPKGKGEAEFSYARRFVEINGEMVERMCVVVDSDRSQANRAEEAFGDFLESEDFASWGLSYPRISLQLSAKDAEDLLETTVTIDGTPVGCRKTQVYRGRPLAKIHHFEVAHRASDALFREAGGDKAAYNRVVSASKQNAMDVFSHAPDTLIFGFWNSFTGCTLGVGNMNGRFPRVFASEVIGVGATEIRGSAVRKDELGINSVVGQEESPESPKGKKSSESGFGAVIAKDMPRKCSLQNGALQAMTISIGGIRELRFMKSDENRVEDLSGVCHGFLAAQALFIGTLLGEISRYRSGCDLFTAPGRDDHWEILYLDGRIERAKVDYTVAEQAFRDFMSEAHAKACFGKDIELEFGPEGRKAIASLLSQAKDKEDKKKTGKGKNS